MKTQISIIVMMLSLSATSFAQNGGLGYSMKNGSEVQTPAKDWTIDTNQAWNMKNGWEPQNPVKEVSIYTNSSLGTQMKGDSVASNSENTGLGYKMKNGSETQSSVNEVNIYTNSGLGVRMGGKAARP